MRTMSLVLALCAASTIGAQVPSAPVAPAAAKASGSKGELRIGGFMINGDRSFDFANSVSTETGSIKGIEVLARVPGIGVGFRSLTGTFGAQPHVTSADARLYLFPKVFSIVVGAQRRALWSDLNATSPTQYDMGIAGVSSTVSIGGSGLRTNLAGAVYLPGGKTKDKIKGGMEGEASVIYRFPVVPLFLQVGYRTEVFTAKANNIETPEEVRGMRFGGGIQLGGR